MDVAQLLEDAVLDCQFWHALLVQDEAPYIMARLAPALAKIACQKKSCMRAVVIASCSSWPAPFHHEDQHPASSPRWRQRLSRKRKAPLSSKATPGLALTLPGFDPDGLLLEDLAKRVRVSRKSTPLAMLGPLAKGGDVFTILARPSPLHALPLPPREVVGLGPLGGELTALVLAHLSFRTKVTVVRSVASGMMKIMEDSTAWDPLQLARSEVKMFMRIITSEDGEATFPSSLSSWDRGRSGSGSGITNVKRLAVDLMEPEEDHLASDSEEDASTSPLEKALRAHFEDPFRGLMFCLQRVVFFGLREFQVANIKPSSGRLYLDSLARLRNDLEHFSMVELTHEVASGTLVYKASLDVPPQPIDLEAASSKNRSRVRSARVFFDSTTTITESEALYLEEVACVYKNGDRFFATFMDDRFGTSSKLIRKSYKPVLAGLKARFPQQLAAVST